MKPLIQRVLLLASAGSAFSCGDPAPAGPQGTPLVYDTAFATSYTQVRSCRHPGEHSGLGAFAVWVSPGAEVAFAGLWADPPSVERMPDGAVVLKEMYAGNECDPAQATHRVVMRKEHGFDPDHADWHWQEVRANGAVTADGIVTSCIDCHRGGDEASCIGYGELHGRDYTCTVPDGT